MCSKKTNKKKVETWLAILAMLLIIVAWFVGGQLENADILSSIKAKMPEITKLEEVEESTYKIYDSKEECLGYLTIESSMGYGGPLKMAVAVDEDGKTFDVAVINSKETPSYLKKFWMLNFLIG